MKRMVKILKVSASYRTESERERWLEHFKLFASAIGIKVEDITKKFIAPLPMLLHKD